MFNIWNATFRQKTPPPLDVVECVTCSAPPRRPIESGEREELQPVSKPLTTHRAGRLPPTTAAARRGSPTAATRPALARGRSARAQPLRRRGGEASRGCRGGMAGCEARGEGLGGARPPCRAAKRAPRGSPAPPPRPSRPAARATPPAAPAGGRAGGGSWTGRVGVSSLPPPPRRLARDRERAIIVVAPRLVCLQRRARAVWEVSRLHQIFVALPVAYSRLER